MTPVIHQTPARRGVVVVGLITAFIDVQKKIEVQSSTLGCCGPKNKLKLNGITAFFRWMYSGLSSLLLAGATSL
jgi:hypothetical protein